MKKVLAGMGSQMLSVTTQQLVDRLRMFTGEEETKVSHDDLSLAHLTADYLELSMKHENVLTGSHDQMDLLNMLIDMLERLSEVRSGGDTANEMTKDRLLTSHQGYFLDHPRTWTDADRHLHLLFLARRVDRQFEKYVITFLMSATKKKIPYVDVGE